MELQPTCCWVHVAAVALSSLPGVLASSFLLFLGRKLLQNFSVGGLKKDNKNLACGTEVLPTQPWG